jgi:hypothetical protein
VHALNILLTNMTKRKTVQLSDTYNDSAKISRPPIVYSSNWGKMTSIAARRVKMMEE